MMDSRNSAVGAFQPLDATFRSARGSVQLDKFGDILSLGQSQYNGGGGLVSKEEYQEAC